MTNNVIYTGPEEACEWLEEALGPDYRLTHVLADPASVAAGLKQADVFLDASMKVPLSAEMLEAASALKLVVTATTGADHIDSATLKKRGIPLKTLAGQTEVLRNITAAAELTWMLIMACARQMRSAIRHVEEGGWDRQQFPGMMLRGRTVGVVGCGRIGTWVSRYAQGFGMKTIGFDPFLEVFPETIEKVTLDEVFANADCVALTLTYSEDTKGVVSAAHLNRMREGAIMVNTSRGAIVNEQDLLNGLKQGKPAFLGTDVLEGEPDIENSPIWQYAKNNDNVIITPHIGGFSPDALKHVLRFTAGRITAFFERD